MNRNDFIAAAKDSTKIKIKKAEAPNTDYLARGILGQFMYINPEKNIVIIRLGDKFGGVKWSTLFREIAEIN